MSNRQLIYSLVVLVITFVIEAILHPLLPISLSPSLSIFLAVSLWWESRDLPTEKGIISTLFMSAVFGLILQRNLALISVAALGIKVLLGLWELKFKRIVWKELIWSLGFFNLVALLLALGGYRMEFSFVVIFVTINTVLALLVYLLLSTVARPKLEKYRYE